MKVTLLNHYHSRSNQDTWKGIRKRFALLNIIISFLFLLILGTCAFFVSRYQNVPLNPFWLVIIVLTVVTTIEIVIKSIFYKVFKYLADLENGLTEIANGDYTIQLSNNRAGFFTVMINNFNKMAQELNKTKILKDDFVNNFSHELKTPLSSINGFAILALDTNSTEENRQSYLKIIRDESFRLAKLADKSLFLTKLNYNSTLSDKEFFYLDTQIRSVIILMQEYWEEKNLTLNVNLQKIEFHSNPYIINEIWINLLSNAIKYSSAGGVIKISLSKNNGKNVFLISDTGIGIHPQKLNYIFSEYYQTDESHSKDGIGLGLSIVHKIVSNINGEISVQSTIGEGTTFRIIF